MRELTLPYSLKKLTLGNTKLPWEDMASKIGCLPLLQVLKLKRYAFVGSEWETVEGQFSSLKFLVIETCDLENWITDDSTHFSRLEHLLLRGVSSLREIPSSIGDIPTLRSIRLETWCGSKCSDSVLGSARRIVDEQEDLGNEDLQLQVEKEEEAEEDEEQEEDEEAEEEEQDEDEEGEEEEEEDEEAEEEEEDNQEEEQEREQEEGTTSSARLSFFQVKNSCKLIHNSSSFSLQVNMYSRWAQHMANSVILSPL